MAPRAASRLGQASGGQREDTRTKQEARQEPELPPGWPVDEAQCLILTRDLYMPDFKAGTPVVITSRTPIPVSPTQYPDQTAVPTNVNDFLYRCKYYKTTVGTEFLSSEGTSTRITGNQLSRTPRGRGSMAVRYQPNDLVYVVDAVPDVRSRVLNKLMKIPIGYRAKVIGFTSSAGPDAPLATANRFTRPYMLEYAVRFVSRDWVVCPASVPGDAFRLPKPQELKAWRNDLAAPRIQGALINVDEVTAA
ncbi:hypothetical protein FKP32DRAFT_259765 [Trametes sanguinea]|nr:hypothetical protein FKP32DRAFT_259765 [Trametes sanguinea]